MTVESQFLIQILSDYILKNKTISFHYHNWPEIARLSRLHQIEGIVYYQCRDFMPSEVRAAFEQLFSATLFIYMNRKTALAEITDTIREAGIRFCTVKGYEVAQFYPVPSLRTMGDCDIVLRESDMSRAVAVMKKLGFKGDGPTAVQQWSCDKNGMHFELHSCLIHYTEQTNHKQKTFFNSYERFLKDERLEWSFHFLFLLMHLRKHFMNEGVGFRQFVDLAVVINYCKELNWDWIQEKLKDLKLDKFAGACFSLISSWFGISVPIEYRGLEPKFYNLVTEKVLRNGVFGYDDPENKDNSAKTALIKRKGPLFLGRISTLLKVVFLKYAVLRGYTGIQYLDGRPYLTPVAWIHRWIILLKRSDKSSIVRTIKRSLIPRRELTEREKLLKGMGL